MRTILPPKPKTGRRHWHPLIDAAIRMGGIRPVKDKNTGRLADEYQWLRYMPGLLNKSGLALDEMARTILQEFPSVSPYIETDVVDGNLYPEDLRCALEDAMREERPGEEEFAPPEDDFIHLDLIDLEFAPGLFELYRYAFALEEVK